VYFWRIRELAEVLGTRGLTQQEAFRYYLVHSVLIAIVAEAPTPEWNLWHAVSAAATAIITAAGLIHCFRSNGGAGGEEFLPRIVSILWVVMIRMMVFTMPIAFAVYVAAGLAGVEIDQTTWWEAVAFAIIETVIYLRAAAHLRSVVGFRNRAVVLH
jgi:hypothetical protein